MTEAMWKAELEREGFVHLPRVLRSEDVNKLATLSLQSINDYSASEDLIRTNEGTPFKLLYPLGKYREFISVLGRREVREIVDSLLPKQDSVLTWEDVLIKMPAVGAEIGAHQDIGLDAVRERIYSLGIPLHSASENPVFFLPGSHRLGPLTATTVSGLWRECKDKFEPVTTQPGDIVIHNIHVLHFSEPNLSKKPRATWYLEFRSMQKLLEKGHWNPDWTFRRRAIWVYARAAGGEDIGKDEPDAVKTHLNGLGNGDASFRVPHITATTRYDGTSPYNHVANWIDDWKTSRPAPGGAHHLKADGHPLHQAGFDEVLPFHAPGLAPVLDASGAYHITPDGQPAYQARYVRTFGFYEDRAAVSSQSGWFHVLPDGHPLYMERYAWCGNFQGGRCPVRLPDGGYFHITVDGVPAYAQRYRYAGDFKGGFAVAQRADGRHTHIDASGDLVHGQWFLDLDVFHKKYARACDARGWSHVGVDGQPLYEARFKNVEPFYNGQARVEGFDGSLSIIGEAGETLVELRKPLRSHLEELSADMVGLWKTQTICAAVELSVFEALPSSAEGIEQTLQLGKSAGIRLMRALTELGLVSPDRGGTYHPTEKGAYLRRTHPLSLADAALLWGGEHYAAWAKVAQALKTGQASFEELRRQNFFDWLKDNPKELEAYHAAMAAYARHDYQSLADSLDFGVHDAILDAGGGAGDLTFALLRAFPKLMGTVMDRPEVVRVARAPEDILGRCRFVAGDLFQRWPVSSGAVVLARVLHDWPDADAVRILRRARQAMPGGGALYLVELVMGDSSPDSKAGRGGLLDLNMLVMTQGAERLREQFQSLLTEAGFEMLDVTHTSSVSSVIRGRAV